MSRTRKLFTRAFWADAGERAVRSFAQGVLAVPTVDAATPWLTSSWPAAIAAGVGMAGYSLLTSIASAPIGDSDTASLLPPPPPPRA